MLEKVIFFAVLLSVFFFGGCSKVVYIEETTCLESDAVFTMEKTVESTKSMEITCDDTELSTEYTCETTVPSTEILSDESTLGNEWYTLSRLIYHACGGIDKANYTNSREALQSTLEQGNMLVEVDFLFTDDGHLVCAHKWKDVFGYEREYTLDEFLVHKIRGIYSGMTAADIIAYMDENPLLHIIVDTKEEDSSLVIAELLRLCDSRPEIADRFVIQLYEPGLKHRMLSLYPFRNENFLFTCYKFGPDKVTQILEVCREEEIKVVTVPYGRWGQASVNRFLNEDILLFEHTVNNTSMTDLSLKKGVYGFYTDFLQVNDLNLPEEEIKTLY